MSITYTEEQPDVTSGRTVKVGGLKLTPVGRESVLLNARTDMFLPRKDLGVVRTTDLLAAVEAVQEARERGDHVVNCQVRMSGEHPEFSSKNFLIVEPSRGRRVKLGAYISWCTVNTGTLISQLRNLTRDEDEASASSVLTLPVGHEDAEPFGIDWFSQSENIILTVMTPPAVQFGNTVIRMRDPEKVVLSRAGKTPAAAGLDDLVEAVQEMLRDPSIVDAVISSGISAVSATKFAVNDGDLLVMPAKLTDNKFVIRDARGFLKVLHGLQQRRDAGEFDHLVEAALDISPEEWCLTKHELSEAQEERLCARLAQRTAAA